MVAIDENEAANVVSDIINDRRAELVKFDLATAKERMMCKKFLKRTKVFLITPHFLLQWVKRKTRSSFLRKNSWSQLRISKIKWISRKSNRRRRIVSLSRQFCSVEISRSTSWKDFDGSTISTSKALTVSSLMRWDSVRLSKPSR